MGDKTQTERATSMEAIFLEVGGHRSRVRP